MYALEVSRINVLATATSSDASWFSHPHLSLLQDLVASKGCNSSNIRPIKQKKVVVAYLQQQQH